MENLVVATFKNIMDATEGLNKLKALDRSGEITIYNLLIITKKRDDHYQLLYYEGIDLARLPDDTQLAALLHNMLDQLVTALNRHGLLRSFSGPLFVSRPCPTT